MKNYENLPDLEDILTEKYTFIKAHKFFAELKGNYGGETDWDEVKPAIVRRCYEVSAELDDERLARDLITSVYREIHRIIVWNCKHKGDFD
jgi:hypothetical protein